MRRALILATLPALLAAQAPTQPQNKTPSEQDVREMIRVTHVSELVCESLQKMLSSRRASNTSLPPEFWDEFSKEITPENLTEMAIPIYQANYTSAEIKALLAFAATPEGKSYLDKSPGMGNAFGAAGNAWVQQTGGKIAQKLHAEGKM